MWLDLKSHSLLLLRENDEINNEEFKEAVSNRCCTPDQSPSFLYTAFSA